MPMPRRIPKRGFKNPNRVEAFPINVETLEKQFAAGETVDLDTLRAKGIVPKLVDTVKILAEGKLTKKLVIKAHRISEAAKAKVEAAGGSVELVNTQVAPKA